VLLESVVMVGRCLGHRTDQAWLVHIEVRMGGRKDCVDGAHDGADLGGSGHDAM